MTIKPITIKPINAKPADAPAPAAPEAAPAAASVPPSGIRPISIKPMAAAAGKAMEPAGAGEATIRLSPVPPPAGAAPRPLAPKPAAPAPLKPKILAAPEPPASTEVTAQAMKGKTSRISLDEALASSPTAAGVPAAMGKLTSNLSAAALAAAKGQTMKVSIPLQEETVSRHQTLRMKAPGAAPAPAAAAEEPPAESEAPTVKRKTLVLKKEGAAGESAEDAKPTLRMKPAGGGKPTLKLKSAGGAPAAEGDKPAEGEVHASGREEIEAGPGAFSAQALQVAKPERTSAFFPICAFASLLVIIATCLLFLSEFSGPDLSYTQYSTWKDGPEVTCPGLPRVTLPR